MKTFTVYVELYGKGFKIDIKANSKAEAMDQVRNDVKFHKVVENSPIDKGVQHIADILGIKL